MKEKGWQDALQAAYPLKIDRFAIQNGDLTYVDKGPFKPLHVTKLNFTTENIQNVQSEKGTYPSPVYLEGVVFDKGRAKRQNHQRDRHRNQEQNVGGFPNQDFRDGHCGVGLKSFW
jgi:hypothetical protein